MSTIITASCNTCRREVTLGPRDITLNVSSRFPSLSHYAFTCPCCESRVEKPATEHVMALLFDNGVVPKTAWEPPAYPEHKSCPDAPPLTTDDLITFGLLLHGAVDIAWWAR